MMAWVLLFLQCVALAGVVVLSRPAAGGHVLFTVFNPLGFFALFFTLYFLLPQVYGLTHDRFLVGFPTATDDIADRAFHSGQVHALFFVIAVAAGVGVGRLLRHGARHVDVPPAMPKRVSSAAIALLVTMLVAGAAANLVLGRQLAASGEFRSSLVKSTGGQLLTVIVFFGNFALAILAYHAVRMKRHLFGFAVVAGYGLTVLVTGSRGRLLWPLAIAWILLVLHRNRLEYRKLLVWSAFLLVALLMMDPLARYLVSGDTDGFGRAVSLATLFEKRNFDGFSNLALITVSERLDPDMSRLFGGARNDFMLTYFPGVYARGVGFGATVPGWFLMSAGLSGMVVLGALYGFGLQILNQWLRKGRSFLTVVGYLFAATWLTAVGGNFVESLDKMIAAAAPAAVLAAALGVRGSKAAARERIELNRGAASPLVVRVHPAASAAGPSAGYRR